MPARLTVERAALEEILPMREAYRREMACQIVHDSWHARGFTDAYLLLADGRAVGYGSVGGAPREARHVVKECYVEPAFRGDAVPMLRRLIAASGARAIEAQTNDRLLMLLLYDCATDISSETILFDDGAGTNLPAPDAGATVRPVTDADRARVFAHGHEPVGEWGIDVGGTLVATGGFALHYNPPYADLHMEVSPEHRRRGFGSYLIQELKRLCREDGRAPAARCHETNVASRLTLQRAGMLPCARILRGRLRA